MRELIEQDIETMSKLIDILNKATACYDAGHPIMPDEEWDDLYFRLENLESTSQIVLPKSPTHHIIYNSSSVSSLAKHVHTKPSLSLQKTKSLEAIRSFLGSKQPGIVMPKLDGLTLVLEYNHGVLQTATTRGDGEVGENVSHNAYIIPSIPKEIDNKGEVLVYGEIIIRNSIFEQIKDKFNFSSSRSAAAGSIRLHNNIECSKRCLEFICWDFIAKNQPVETLHEALDLAKENGFHCVNYDIGEGLPKENEDEDEYHHRATTLLDTSDLPIDGLVFKFDNIEYYNQLGRVEHHYKGGIAWKFYDEIYDTKLIDIEWSMGRTGKLTPVAIFEPIEIDGTIVERANLHNESILEETLGIPYKNQPIGVAKINMIIPQILKSEKLSEGQIELSIMKPKVCPICGSATKIIKEGAVETLWCVNEDCDGKLINKLNHFCGKKGLDIKGLSTATLEKLIDWGWVETYENIFNLSLHRNEWIKKAGFGEKSVDNILNNIELAKNTDFVSFIAAIGIPLVGTAVAKIINSNISDYSDFRKKVDDKFDFSILQGFGDNKTTAIWDFDYTDADAVYPYLNFSKAELALEKSEKLSGLTIVITGSLNNFKNRGELQQLIEKNGGKNGSSITKATSLLINNDSTSNSTKNLTAKKFGIPIYTEEEFIKKFDI